jgi:hypothetical protein
MQDLGACSLESPPKKGISYRKTIKTISTLASFKCASSAVMLRLKTEGKMGSAPHLYVNVIDGDLAPCSSTATVRQSESVQFQLNMTCLKGRIMIDTFKST